MIVEKNRKEQYIKRGFLVEEVDLFISFYSEFCIFVLVVIIFDYLNNLKSFLTIFLQINYKSFL